MALAPMLRAPDILIGEMRALVAVRERGRRIVRRRRARASFELERWLEHDGGAPLRRGSGEGHGLLLRRHRLPRRR